MDCGDLRHNTQVNSPLRPGQSAPTSGTGSTATVAAVDLAALVRDAADAIITLDTLGRVTGWNPAAERLLGHRCENVLGRAAPHLPPPHRLPGSSVPGPGRGVVHRLHAGGYIVELLASVSPINGADGALQGWSEILRAVTPDTQPLALVEEDIARLLAGAPERGELEIVYQPIFRLADRQPVGAEALLRWHRPADGVLLPDRFIHLAERDGLITSFGLFAMRRACDQVAAWQHAGVRALPVSVNVSAHQFRLPDFATTFAAAIAQAGIDPTWLKLEITESALVEEPAVASARLAELRALGVGIAIDDFGVGYSSLSRLRQYPIDTLKVDRSFVRDIATDPISREVMGAIIRLAHKLGLTVVAEGIEASAQLEVLLELGCDAGQGFLLARPMSAAELGALATPG